jgi:serine/threonine protein kinase
LPIDDNNEELKREENLLKKNINSPYVVKRYGSFIANNCKHFVMEYCEGGTLKDLIDYHRNQKKYISEIVFFFS